MNALYFCNYDVNDKTSGVSKKIIMQSEAFRNIGVNLILPKVYARSLFDKIVSKFPFINSNYDSNVYKYLKTINDKNIDFVYFRHNTFTKQLYKNFEFLKSLNIKIVYEIPTYPYDNINHKLWNLMSSLNDKHWRIKCSKLIDYIVDFGNNKDILGVKTINISNGIDVNSIKPVNDASNNYLELIGVALLDRVHGYDRIINGIYEYNNKSDVKIKFHIVGTGDEYANLRNITRNLKLGQYVVFHGQKSGDELDKIFSNIDIGIGALGLHRRSDNLHVSSLKSREYAARGVPIIYEGYDKPFESEQCDFKYKVEAVDSAIDLDEILSWYNKLINSYKNKKELVNHIRNFAKENLSWEIQLKKVIDYLK